MPAEKERSRPPSPGDTPAPVLLSLPDGPSLGGVTTWTLHLARHLASHGHPTVLIVHDSRPGGQAPLSLPAGIRVVHARGVPPLRQAGSLSANVRFYAELLCEITTPRSAPAVYCPTLLGDAFGVGAALCLAHPDRVRVVGWQHSDNPYDERVLSFYEPMISCFVAVSGHIARGICARHPGRTRDVHTIPCGVPIPPEPPPREPLPGRPLRLIYTGRIEQSNKRVQVLVLLSDLLARRRVPHTLTLMGDGPDTGEIARLLAAPAPGELPRKQRVILTGAREPAAVSAALASSDVFLLSSRHEGLSISMLEAMAHGCVPVVTRVASGAAEVIDDLRNGLLVPFDPTTSDEELAQRLADALGRCMETGLGALSQAARKTAQERFAIGSQAAGAAEVIARAARGEPRPWPAERPCAFAGVSPGFGSGTVPTNGPKRLGAVLASLEGRGLVLHGAGRHTIELARTIAGYSGRILAIADDDPSRWGEKLLGWTVIDPAKASALGATDVVISSWIHQEAVWARRGVYESQGLRVHRVYT